MTQIYTLFTYPDYQSTQARDIYEDNIVGTYTDANKVSHGFIFNITTGSYKTIDVPGAFTGPGATCCLGTFPMSIDGNIVAGHFYKLDYAPNGTYGSISVPFVYDITSGGFTTFKIPGLESPPQIRAISQNFILGSFSPGGITKRFIYNMTTSGISYFDGSFDAQDIDDENIIGSYTVTTGSNIGTHGRIYNFVDNAITDFDLSSATKTQPTRIYGNKIIGRYLTNSSSIYRGFMADTAYAFVVSSKNNGGPSPCPTPNAFEKNPINTATGNKFQAETDYFGATYTGLRLERFYNSMNMGSSPFGASWRGTWNRTLNYLAGTGANPETVLVTHEDGRTDSFRNDGNRWVADPDVTCRLSGSAGSGWLLVHEDDSTESYAPDGRLLSIKTRAGLVTTLIYDGSQRLIKVIGHFGQQIDFAYDSYNRINIMTAPDGGIYTYAYNANNSLISVIYPDGAKRQYLYENTSYPHLLTGIVDENSNRFATYTYDMQARAISTEHAGGVGKIAVTYDTDKATVTDADNNTHTYNFTTQFDLAKPTSIDKDECGCRSAAYTYDENGFLASRIDFNGNVTTYEHDNRGLELSQIEASGTPQAKTITTTWHETFHLPLTITEQNRTTTFTYDEKGNLLTKTITAGDNSRSWSYTYNTNGQILTETDPLNNTNTYTYNAQGGVATMTNSMGQVTKITSYDVNGYPFVIEDPNGLITTLTYDSRNRLTSQTRGAEVTRYAYDALGQLTQITFPDGAFNAYSYDAAHRLIGISDALGNHIGYTLDAMSNKIKEEVFDSGNVLKRSRAYAYDSMNRLSKIIGAQGHTTSYDYDGNGNITGTTDPLNHTFQYTYDPLNRLIKTLDPNSKIITYSYNMDGMLKSITDPRGLNTTYSYDGLANPTGITSPDNGSTIKTFDATGNVLTSTDARGEITSYSYDGLNRVIKITNADTTTTTYQYDQGSNGIGHLTGMTDSSGSTAWIYSSQSRVLQKRQQIGSVSLSTTYQYDETTGSVTSMIYPSGKVIAYFYNDLSGLPTSCKIGNDNLLSSIHYAPFGLPSSWTYGNGATYQRTFDQDGRISQIKITGNFNDTIDYSYDSAGRIIQINDTLSPPDISTGSSSLSYAADSNRIVSSSGNLAQSYTYDSAGNLLQDGSHTFTYNARGILAKVTSNDISTQYAINGLGQRIKKSGPSVETGANLFVYDEQGHLIGEYDADGNSIEETVWLGDMPVAVIKGSALHYVYADHLGAPRIITDQTDKVVWKWIHDPYGNGDPKQPTGSFVYNLRFPGQYYDSETGLSYNMARYYDQKVGRYIQSDPIGLRGGINPYNYVRSNPVSLIDPSGHSWYSALFKASVNNFGNPTTLSERAEDIAIETATETLNGAAESALKNNVFDPLFEVVSDSIFDQSGEDIEYDPLKKGILAVMHNMLLGTYRPDELALAYAKAAFPEQQRILNRAKQRLSNSSVPCRLEIQ